MLNKKGQVTIFIIIAVLIVAGIALFFLLKDRITLGTIPADFKSIEDYFLDCIQENMQYGVAVLGQQGGYINVPQFEPGSEYAPFSNMLDFQGFPVPYWYYVSGNNLIKEQVPSRTEMQNQLADFVRGQAGRCDFSSFESQGFNISLDIKSTSVKINNLDVQTNVNANLVISKGNEKATVSQHNVKVDSKLGKFYSKALEIYNKEKKEMFLENYAVDVLRLYAPVDGVELSCAPKVWMKQNVDKDIKEALEANMQAIKLKGSYYVDSDKYFVQDIQTDEAVNFLYSRDWPTRIETWDSNNGVMMAEPVGLQAGLGILGFCYVSYHFVYDVFYPVLIQIYDNKEMFQFPVAVVINKNKPREALPTTFIGEFEPELCKYKVQDVTVYTYNTNLEAIEADISFNCLRQTCNIGKTKIEGNEAILQEKFPQCVNGYVIAKANEYAYKKYLISTNQEVTANIILDKLYNLSIDFKVNSQATSDNAVISFVSADNSQTIVWPEQKIIKLSEGLYNVSVYVYRNSSITLPAMKKEQCVEVPKEGLAGILGATEEKCFNVDLPSQQISNVISGGGKASEYVIESQLEKGKIEINVEGFDLPRSLEQLQDSYGLLEVKPVYINFG